VTASSAAVRRVLDALERGGQAPRANGAGWAVRCPAHDDGVASLSVNEGEDGRALFCCHVGCATADIVAALGLKLADLFEAPRANVRETRYEVRDASGVLVAVHVRRDGLEGKRFHWERDGKPTLGGIRVTSLPLYASELVHGWPVGEPVFIVEGEKAADALRRHSFNAVATVCGAASCPTAAVLEVLRGRDVVLWPDADEPGRRHMQEVAARLEGIAARVRLFEWAEAPERGDAADYFAQGGAAEALRGTLEGASQSIPPRSGEVSKTQPARAVEANPEPAGRKKRLLARQGRELAFADPDPWPEPVDGAT